MIWENIILICGIVSSLYAFPYGKWEWKQQNKIGGAVVYALAILCVLLATLQIII